MKYVHLFMLSLIISLISCSQDADILSNSLISKSKDKGVTYITVTLETEINPSGVSGGDATRTPMTQDNAKRLQIDFDRMVQSNKPIKVFCALREKGDVNDSHVIYFKMDGNLKRFKNGYRITAPEQRVELGSGFSAGEYYVQCMFVDENVSSLENNTLMMDNKNLLLYEENSDSRHYKIPLSTQWSKVKIEQSGTKILLKNLYFTPQGVMLLVNNTNIKGSTVMQEVDVAGTGFVLSGEYKLGKVRDPQNFMNESLYFEPSLNNESGGLDQWNWCRQRYMLKNKAGQDVVLRPSEKFSFMLYAYPTQGMTINGALISSQNLDFKYVYSKGEKVNKAINWITDKMKIEFDWHAFLNNGMSSKIEIPITKKAVMQKMYMTHNWMKYLSDDFPFFKILLPGTHDTEAVEFSGIWVGSTGLGQCQDHHIPDQLRAGVRALDIRLKDWYGKFYVYHGPMATNIEFRKNVLDEIEKFLKENPTETVVMMVKDENGKGNGKYSSQLVRELLSHPIKQRLVGSFDINTTLQEMRGKVLVLTRDNLYSEGMVKDGDFPYGAMLANWGDNENNHQIYIYPYANVSKNFTAIINDTYKSISTEKKIDLVKDHLVKSSDRINSGVWTINYASLSGNPGHNAYAINPPLVDFINGEHIPFSGILYMDFVTRASNKGPEIMTSVIENNLR